MAIGNTSESFGRLVVRGPKCKSLWRNVVRKKRKQNWLMNIDGSRWVYFHYPYRRPEHVRESNLKVPLSWVLQHWLAFIPILLCQCCHLLTTTCFKHVPRSFSIGDRPAIAFCSPQSSQIIAHINVFLSLNTFLHICISQAFKIKKKNRKKEQITIITINNNR